MGLFTPNIQKLESAGDIDALLKHTRHRKADIRLQIFNSLINKLTKDEILEKLRHMLTDPDPIVRTAAVLKFADLGDDSVFEHLRSIIINGTNKDKISTLRKLTSKDNKNGASVSGVLVLALNDSNTIVQITAIKCMGTYKGRLFLDHLVTKIYDRQYQIRLEAVRSLGYITVEEALDPLIGALVDNNRQVRWAARESIERIGSPRAHEILKNAPFMLLVKNMNDSVLKKQQTAEHIGRHRISEALPLLYKACTDEYKNVRIEAVRAIGNIRDKSSVKIVARLLDDPYFDARLEAVKALGKIFDPAVLPLLDRARNDANKNVRDEAEQTYHNMKVRLANRIQE